MQDISLHTSKFFASNFWVFAQDPLGGLVSWNSTIDCNRKCFLLTLSVRDLLRLKYKLVCGGKYHLG